jgi:hypothetical protein
MPGLVDVDALSPTTTTPTSRGVEGDFAGGSRPQRGAFAGPSRGGLDAEKPSQLLHLAAVGPAAGENAHLDERKTTSYPQAVAP